MKSSLFTTFLFLHVIPLFALEWNPLIEFKEDSVPFASFNKLQIATVIGNNGFYMNRDEVVRFSINGEVNKEPEVILKSNSLGSDLLNSYLSKVGENLIISKIDDVWANSADAVPATTWIVTPPYSVSSIKQVDEKFLSRVEIGEEINYFRPSFGFILEGNSSDVWIANPGNSNLFYSDDLGNTWKQADKKDVNPANLTVTPRMSGILHEDRIYAVHNGWVDATVLYYDVPADFPNTLIEPEPVFIGNFGRGDWNRGIFLLQDEPIVVLDRWIYRVDPNLDDSDRLILSAFTLRPDADTYFLSATTYERSDSEILVGGELRGGVDNSKPFIASSYDGGTTWHLIDYSATEALNMIFWVHADDQGRTFAAGWNHSTFSTIFAQLATPGDLVNWILGAEYQQDLWWKCCSIGYIYAGDSPWFWLQSMNTWCYRPINSGSSKWAWNKDLGWLYLTENSYPNLYSSKLESWLYFSGRYAEVNWYYSYNLKSWLSI